MRIIMRNPIRLPERREKRNKNTALVNRVGKQLASVALAFTAQYSPLMPTRSAAASQVTARQAAETTALKPVDQDLMLADEARTSKLGMSQVSTSMILAFPVVNPEDSKRYFMVYQDGDVPCGESDACIQQLAALSDCRDCQAIYPDSPGFLENTEALLKQGNLTGDQKRQIYFARAYFWAAMKHWKHGDGQRQGLSIDGQLCDEGFAEAVEAFRSLDDGSEWFQERLKDLKIFEAILEATAHFDFTFASKAVARDIDNYSRRVSYVATVQEAAQIMHDRTAAYLAGSKPTSEFMMDQALFGRLADFNLRYLKRLPEKGWWADQRYRDAMATIEAILPAFQQAFDAVGTGPQLQNLQQAREQVVHAEQLLGYQTILASSAYHYPGITAEDLASWADRNFQTAQALLNEHSPEKLHLPAEIEQHLQQTQFAYLQAAPQYERLANAAGAGQKLRDLFAKVEGQNGSWATADKQALQHIYSAVLNSSSGEAEREFLAVLREGIRVSRPAVSIQPFEETGLTQNYALSPIIREINGVKVETTEHPVDTIDAKFSIENTLPIPIRVTFVMELSGADNPRDVREVLLPANKIADVHYTGHVSITQTRRGGGSATPRADLLLAMDGVQEVASAPMGEQLARAD